VIEGIDMLQSEVPMEAMVAGFEAKRGNGVGALAIALIGPQTELRREMARVLAELQCGVALECEAYPELDEIPKLMDRKDDVFLVDLDANPEYALDLIESICGRGPSTVMVYSERADPEWMVRCMRAGAREFLTRPYTLTALAEALIRASARQPQGRPVKRALGEVCAFFGSKGGSGVTTVACNFAVLLARESGKKTLLIDLDLPLGDAALNLGATAAYSTIDALENCGRLDAMFLSKLLVEYGAGLSLLLAPGRFCGTHPSKESVQKLLSVARQDFEYVVVDCGTQQNAIGMSIFEQAARTYLVTQVGIPDLRNANRIVTEFFAAPSSKLEIVLNRYAASALGVDEEHITKALTRPAQWKIPEDCAGARKTQNTGAALAAGESPIARAILQMARACCGVSAQPEKKASFFAKFRR
jgi:pilus assembly protein CpaE